MKVLIIGAGQMGNGIAQVCAQAGYETYLNDLTLELAEKGLLNIEKNLIKMTAKGKLDESEKNRIMSRITLTDNYDAGADCDIVIEAATENLGIKQKIFASLDSVCDERTILATNTSSLPITEIAAATKRAEKVIGMHFMHPVPVMSLVEIISGIATSDETYKSI